MILEHIAKLQAALSNISESLIHSSLTLTVESVLKKREEIWSGIESNLHNGKKLMALKDRIKLDELKKIIDSVESDDKKHTHLWTILENICSLDTSIKSGSKKWTSNGAECFFLPRVYLLSSILGD